ncbi:DUF7018 domain-containing (lipo)protein [Aneurinibacillus uraniidurans]|uniref:DUF7018 domain-containing (lipo)protein n=1 Tax=Aneurinibacillus uraniidurans TaxID=2966586 RepID=UPI00234B915E|nr:hypothetical protein [Aneurinibacillus sp. B1]WCN36556.1 hypothetical protein PO771_11770 [Aneurinibacillus sp. B1]
MKKVTIFLSVMISLALLSGCGGKEASAPKETSTQSQTQPAQETKPVEQPKPEPKVETNGLSEADKEYQSAFVANTTALTKALLQMSEVSQQFDGSDNWKKKMAAALAMLKNGVDDAKKLKPTPRFQEVHNSYMKAIAEFEKVPDLIAKGIDKNDVTYINKATDKMVAGSQMINQTMPLIQKAFK